jgi:hypothetical protein
MLVVFTNKSGGTVEMFEKSALELIKLMGRREAVPSAISAEDLPEALETMNNALIEMAQIEKAEDQEADLEELEEDEDQPKPIGLSTRAFPLTELIKQTIKEGSFLMWDHK